MTRSRRLPGNATLQFPMLASMRLVRPAIYASPIRMFCDNEMESCTLHYDCDVEIANGVHHASVVHLHW
jgi:hypothetical protein